MANLARSMLPRWLLATVAFPIGGFLGHLIGGPAFILIASLISGGLAGAIIGLAEGLALKLRSQELLLWAGATALGLAVGLAAMIALVGPITSLTEAIGLGAVSGLLVGALQAVLLQHRGIQNSWMWVLTSIVAWSIGWLVTTSIGVSFDSGWPVFGLSGAIVCQLITGLVIWRLTQPLALST